MEVVLTDKNFQKEVLEEEIPVLVDFYADWCPPCRVLAPIISGLAEEFEGKIKVGKLNVDENPQTASKYQIMSIPTLMIFKEGEVVERVVGVRPKEALKERIKHFLSP